MNPKLIKERIRTSAQRPDIIIAFQNVYKHSIVRHAPGTGEPKAAISPEKTA